MCAEIKCLHSCLGEPVSSYRDEQVKHIFRGEYCPDKADKFYVLPDPSDSLKQRLSSMAVFLPFASLGDGWEQSHHITKTC